MANDKANVGLIVHPDGAHLAIYFSSLAGTPEVDGVFLADPTGEMFDRAREILKEKLKETYRNVRTMLEKHSPQLAVVSLEAAAAPPSIDSALDAGCHVLTEKPACVRLEDYVKLAQKADSKHLRLMPALANRLNPPVLEARRLIRTGALGKIYGVDMHIIADQTRLTQTAYHTSWFAHKDRAGGGHLIWLGIHWLDLAMHITGLDIQDVAAFVNNAGGQPIDVEDSATVVLRFDNGSLGTLTSAYYLDKGYHTQIKVWGERGWLELGDLDRQPLTYSLHAAGKIEEFTYQPGQGGYEAFVRAAVRSCLDQGEAPISNADGLRVLKTIFACYESAESECKQRVGA